MLGADEGAAGDLGQQPGETVRGTGQMPPTLWTLVLSARDLQSPGAQAALAKLCEIYWFPLYAFVRRQGHEHHQAQDLTQGFFEYPFKRAWLEGVSREKGRFRTFLLRALSNFMINEREKELSLKRGGAVEQFVSWDAELAETRLSQTPALETEPTPEFERLWACALVEKALAALKQEYIRNEKPRLFVTLLPFMTRPVPPGFYERAAADLQMTEGALRTARTRFLQSFGELLRAEVLATVGEPTDVEDELRQVLKAWARQV